MNEKKCPERKDVRILKKKIRYAIRLKYAVLTAILFCLTAAVGWRSLQERIPDHLQVASDNQSDGIMEDALPDWVETKAVEAGSLPESNIPRDNLNVSGNDSYTVQCSLLGIVPVKEIQVDVVERQKVTAGGVPVGIYMKTEGVLIVGTGEVCGMDGTTQEPVGDMVHSGDYILEVNGVSVSDKEEVVQQINQAVNKQVQLKILRNGEAIELQVPVVQTGTSEYKAGIWVRDDTQGIGTLTYVQEDGSFGALGHGISDIDTSTLLTLKEGRLYETDIRAIIKGEDGLPGELAGVIRYQEDRILGSISSNTDIGIFGELTSQIEELSGREDMEIAYKQEVQQGSAAILSAVSGNVEEYDIEIEKVNLNSNDANKSMVIRVTDPRLLEITGGIVQGMSGSPIIQNGRIVGAVTHVFVNDPTKGYGIFIENMLEH